MESKLNKDFLVKAESPLKPIETNRLSASQKIVIETWESRIEIHKNIFGIDKFPRKLKKKLFGKKKDYKRKLKSFRIAWRKYIKFNGMPTTFYPVSDEQ